MFDSSYAYHFVQKEPAQNEDVFEEVFVYKFVSGKGTPYIVRVEKYPFAVFAIKFYSKKHSQATNRYSLYTHEGNPMPILRTCINIFLEEILNQDPMASMGFIGVPAEGESSHSTKRFRIYRYIMENFFSTALFSHHRYLRKSIYLVLNRKNKEPDILEKIEELFADYDLFEDKEE
jgi:hypothetical protein